MTRVRLGAGGGPEQGKMSMWLELRVTSNAADRERQENWVLKTRKIFCKTGERKG
jgi:hypothetical protein